MNIFKGLFIILFLLAGNNTYAISKTWNLTDPLNYVNTNDTTIVDGVGKLKIQLIHEGSIIDGGGIIPFLDRPESIIVDGNYNYIIGRSNALEIIDISNPNLPLHVSALTTVFGGGAFNRPTDMMQSGNFLYIANSRGNTIEVVDISNPLIPLNISSISTTFGGGAFNRPGGLFISGNTLYVVGRNSSLEIIDITNPALLVNVGSVVDAVRLNRPSDVVIQGNYAYIASNRNNSLEIIDISNGTLPVFAGQLLDGGGIAPYLNRPVHLDIQGNYIYIIGGSSALEVIDISNPLIPLHAGSILDGGGVAPFLNTPTEILIDGNIAYITDNGSDAIQLIDISNPLIPKDYTSAIADPIILLGGANTITKSGALLFIGSNIDNAVEIMSEGYSATTSIPGLSPLPQLSLTLTGNLVIPPNNPESIIQEGIYTYLLQNTSLEIIDTSNPTLPINIITTPALTFFNNAIDMVQSGNYLYIADDGSNTIEIIDISNPINPIIETPITTVFGGAALNRPTGLFVSGNLLYMVGRNNSLEIYDISNPLIPVSIGSVIDGARLNRVNDVVVEGNYAYVIGRNDSLEVIDISNPINPILVGQLLDGGGVVPYLARPDSIALKGNYVYITSSRNATLEIIDITNPLLPIHAGSMLDGGGVAPFLNTPTELFIDGNILYVTDQGSDALQLININNPALPTVNTSFISAASLGQVNTITKSGSLIYLGSINSSNLAILEESLSSGVSTSSLIYLGDTTFANRPESIIIDGNYAYLSDRTPTINVLDISNPTFPNVVTSIPIVNRPTDMAQSGSILFVANRGNVVDIYDISKPLLSIPLLGTVPLIGRPNAIFLDVKNSILYVVGRSDSLEIFDVSNSAAPISLGTLIDPVRLQRLDDIVVSGNYAYVGGRNNSLEVIDISNPVNPILVGQLLDGGGVAPYLDTPAQMDISGNYLYIVGRSNALEIVDITNPLLPVHYSSILDGLGVAPFLDRPEDILVDGNTVYISSRNSNAVQLIDITDPLVPIAFDNIVASATNLLLGANVIEKVGPLLYVGSRTSLAFSIIYETPPANTAPNPNNGDPHIINNLPLVYSGSIDKITSLYGLGNQGILKYQISKDNGNTWYYLTGSTWQVTTEGAFTSNTPNEINTEIQTFNGLAGGTGEFKWQAFLIGDGSQQVEIDSLNIDYTSAGTNEIIDFETPGGYTVIQGTFSRTLTNPQEGLYSIESGNNINNSTSCFEVSRTIYNDSTINFQKNVSSELDYDFLRFYIDGFKIDEWSGNSPWAKQTYDITPGNRIFKWCYEKDGNTSALLDTAWVDYIELIEKPIISEVTVLDFEVVGGYTVTTAVTTPGPDWIRQQNTVFEGLYAAESQNKINNSLSCFQRIQTVSVTDTGISFYKKVSSELNFDFLTFSINGIEQSRWSGIDDWTKETYTLVPSTYTLDWCYEKDVNASGGSDSAWIDLVTVTQDPPVLAEVTPVITPTNDPTPDYTFYTPIAGTISYGGSCISSTNTGAIVGNNTVTFDSLADGIYTNCTIQIIASPQNSTTLSVANFTIDTTGINITINLPLDSSTIANADFILDTSYSDAQVGVNTGSIVIGMYKWNGSSYGSDISATYINYTGAIIGGTGALYDVFNPGGGQFKIIFTISDNLGNQGSAITVFNISLGDIIGPDITSINYLSGSLLPGGNHNIKINYNDLDSGVNINSDVIVLYKWDGVSWGPDISGTGLLLPSKTITTTGATYPTNNLIFGKYQYIFQISDNNSNISSTGAVFYIDQPELIISTGTLDLGTLIVGSNKFSNLDFTITLKTVGAGFDLIINNQTTLNYAGTEIIDWNGIKGFGYDKNPYTSTINLINTNQIIATQAGSINTNGNKNIYIYNVKLGANIDKEQAAGNYTGNISFGARLNY